VSLYEITSEAVASGGNVVIHAINYRTVCSAPCDDEVDVSAGRPFFFGGPGLTPSRRFSPSSGGSVQARVRPGRKWTWNTGIIALGLGLSGVHRSVQCGERPASVAAPMPHLTSITWALALAVAPRADAAAPIEAPTEDQSAKANDAPFETIERAAPTEAVSHGFELPAWGEGPGPSATPPHDRATASQEHAQRPGLSTDSSPLPPRGTAPFSFSNTNHSGDNLSSAVDVGPSPSTTPATSELELSLRAPLGAGPTLAAPEAPDPRTVRLLRFNVQTGAVLRLERLEPLITANVELGREQGVSASFHASMIVAPDRNFVRVFDFPMGFGVLARGRARKRPLYGSVGLSAGILLHRANSEIGVLHRVDPDLRLPLRGTWTPRGGAVGLSVALVQGWSVRRRSYERRGLTVWSRHPYRIGIVLGLHFDVRAGRARTRPRRSGKPEGRDHDKH